jgi:CGNR zinc finger
VDVFPVPQVELSWVVELVNEFSDPTRAAAGEQDEPYPELSPPDGFLAGQPWKTAELVGAANDLHGIFDAAERGESVEGAINAILDRARPWQRANPAGIGFAVADARNVLPAACALALLEWIAARGTRRIGVCDAGRCVDVFADASAGGHRRFCSAICSNRHRVAQYRARQREQTRGP